MPIITNDQTTKDILAIEAMEARLAQALGPVHSLARSVYDALWQLPEPRMVAVLQRMQDDGVLGSTFLRHYTAMTALNTLSDCAGVTDRAPTVAGRAFEVQDGVVCLVQPHTEPAGIVADEPL